jgi:hypothetical protein
MTNPTTLNSVVHLSNAELLSATARLARFERAATVQLVAALAEVDERRLFLGEGYSSMYTYCTKALRQSEYCAYMRISAARLVRRFPVVLEMLAEGSLTLTTACQLRPYLTNENHAALLDAARYKSKREVELQLAASMMTKRDARTGLPADPADPSAATSPADATATDWPLPVSAPPAVVTPLSAGRFEVHFTISKETHDKLRRLQDLMRHQVPTGDVAEIVDKGLTLLLEQVERQKTGAARRPRPRAAARARTRHVPMAVKREVWERDRGRCAFIGAQGRCEEPGFIEYHHVQPYSAGGPTTAANLELRCRAHNQYEAELAAARDAAAPEVAPVTVRPPPENGTLDESPQLGPDQVAVASPGAPPSAPDINADGGSADALDNRGPADAARTASAKRYDTSTGHEGRVDVVTEQVGRGDVDHE